MGLKLQIDQDLKQALLAGDKFKATTLRGIKSVILNEEIARGVKDAGLEDEAILQCLKKESKKRQEAADLYKKAGSIERETQELSEKRIIEHYLPEQMPESEIATLVDKAIASHDKLTQASMGTIIGEVKQLSNGLADGAVIARIVKEKLSES